MHQQNEAVQQEFTHVNVVHENVLLSSDGAICSLFVDSNEISKHGYSNFEAVMLHTRFAVDGQQSVTLGSDFPFKCWDTRGQELINTHEFTSVTFLYRILLR